MEKDAQHPEEESHLSALEETDGGTAHPQDGRGAKGSRYIKVQLYMPLKEVILMDELRLKRMRQGQDMTRSRLVSEAIRLLTKDGSEVKTGVRG